MAGILPPPLPAYCKPPPPPEARDHFPDLTSEDAGDGWTFEVRGRAGLGTNRSLVTARITGVTIVA